ncbi:MAG: peptide ABC transporter substrate-binding protein [Patescibacteria group bacterium]|jgi:peptide/nickel transport system substrate-binding protein
MKQREPFDGQNTEPANPASARRHMVLLNQIRNLYQSTKSKLPTVRQLAHCGLVFSKRERQLLAGCFAIITASLIWLGVNQVSAHLVINPAVGGAYQEAIVGQPSFLNPIFANARAVDVDLTRLTFSGLMRYDVNLKPVPDLADSVTVSDDGKTYTFTLHDNLLWHDNEALTVDDVIFTYESLTDPELRSPLSTTFRGVVVERVNDKTVRFTLKEPYADFLDTLTVGIIPQHIWGKIPAAQWRLADFNIRPVGSGPWQFASLNQDRDGFIKSYTMTRADSRPVAGYLDRLVFKFFTDEPSAISALRNHSVDGFTLLSSDGFREFARRDGGFTHYDLHLPAVSAVFFNLGQSGPLGTLAIRQALDLAVDRRALVLDTLPGEAAVSTGPLPTISYDAETKESPHFDKEGAEKLLDQAGWKLDGNTRKNKKGDALEITLTILDRDPDRTAGQFIQTAWQAIGVNTKIDLISPATPMNVQRTVLRPRAYQALLYTIVYGARPDPYPFWHSSQRVDPGLNLSLFNDSDADKAIEKIRRSNDEAIRNQGYDDLRKAIGNAVPAVFLYTPTKEYIINDDVRGITVNAIASLADRLNNLDSWYIKTTQHIIW